MKVDSGIYNNYRYFMAIRLNLSSNSDPLNFWGQFLRKIGGFNIFDFGEEAPVFDQVDC